MRDFIKQVIYPKLEENPRILFAEHNFIKLDSKWTSQTLIDGSPSNNILIYSEGVIHKPDGYRIGVFDYLMIRNDFSFYQAVKLVCKLYNIFIPNRLLIIPNIKENHRLSSSDINSLCNIYFKNQLSIVLKSNGNNITRHLLSLGYNLEDIENMDFGLLPKSNSLFKYLIGQNYSKECIEESISGEFLRSELRYNYLTLPERENGKIISFYFIKNGYYNAQNSLPINNVTAISKTFLTLSTVKFGAELIILDNILDVAYCTYHGLENISTYHEKGINPTKIGYAMVKGHKSFHICVPVEKPVNENIQLIKKFLLCQPIELHISIDNSFSNLINFISTSGIDALKNVLNKRVAYYEYFAIEIINSIAKMTENDSGNEILERISEFHSIIHKSEHRNIFLKKLLDSEIFISSGIDRNIINEMQALN
jgi:hypothetical protein